MHKLNYDRTNFDNMSFFLIQKFIAIQGDEYILLAMVVNIYPMLDYKFHNSRHHISEYGINPIQSKLLGINQLLKYIVHTMLYILDSAIFQIRAYFTNLRIRSVIGGRLSRR